MLDEKLLDSSIHKKDYRFTGEVNPIGSYSKVGKVDLTGKIAVMFNVTLQVDVSAIEQQNPGEEIPGPPEPPINDDDNTNASRKDPPPPPPPSPSPIYDTGVDVYK